MRKKIVAGNWKMNKTLLEGKQLVEEIKKQIGTVSDDQEVIIIPPFIHLSTMNEIVENSPIKIGSQNNHAKSSGAYTGEVSAAMLKSTGVTYGLVGHSERRTYSKETDEELLEKLKALIAEGIQPIFCCGEQLADRKANLHLEKVAEQLGLLWGLSNEEFDRVIIAYEPVWAIGTGETASADQAQEMHAHIRDLVAQKMGTEAANTCSLLYGGSCKPTNAEELFSKKDVDGGLIGGASLKAEDFLGIVRAMQS